MSLGHVTSLISIVGFLTFAGTKGVAASVSENFSSNPVLSGRFVQQTASTESSFSYNASNQNLMAVLDVDHNAAFYLSSAFEPVADTNSISFSMRFRITGLDDRASPTAFFGLLTTNHVEDFGDGLTMTLSGSNGVIVGTATIDAHDVKFGGSPITLASMTDYLLVGRYSDTLRQFTVEVYGGDNFLTLVGRSVTPSLPVASSFAVNRIGLQNGGARLTDANVGSITLLTDDLYIPAQAPTTLAINDVAILEQDVGTTNLVFTVSLSSSNAQTVTVDFTTVNVTATSGLDYVATNGTLTFVPGVQTQTISIPVIGDSLVESNETFKVVLSNPVNASLADTEGIGTITDNDQTLLSINDATIRERVGGTNAVFAVTLNVTCAQTVTVSYATADGSANAGLDYVGTSGTLTFPPGVTNQTTAITVSDDFIAEPDETFFVNLYSPVNAVLVRSQGQAVIKDNDPLPGITISPITIEEGNAGPRNAVFTVLLSNPSAQVVSVIYTTADGTAVAGNDYASASGTLFLAPGSTSQTFSITIWGESVYEADEHFLVNLTSPNNATCSVSQAQCIIQNDDPIPAIYLDDNYALEGNTGTTNLSFRVWLSNPSDYPIAANYATSDGDALAGSDYIATNGAVLFAPGQTNQFINVTVSGDTLEEADETLFLNLTSPTNASLGRSQAAGTIRNDDGVLILISDSSVVEGNAGQTNLVFNAYLSLASSRTVSVAYATADLTAAAGSDYLPRTGTLVFLPGTTSQTIAVPVLGDVVAELNEIFLANLSNPINASLGRSQAQGTIIDDDPPTASIGNATVTERNGGVALATFRVDLSKPPSQAVTVNYFTTNGTATAGSDYLSASGTLSFDPFQTVKNIEVSILGDTVYENNETFFVTLTNPVNAALAGVQGIGTILNDDPMPTVFADDFNFNEGNCIDIPVFLSAPSEVPITVEFSTTNGTAIAGVDYFATNGFLIFQPGQTSLVVTVCAIGDSLDDGDKSFDLEFRGGGGGGGPRGARGIILNIDPPAISVATTNVVEGNTGTTNLVFQLSLTSSRPYPISVNYTNNDNTATAGVDYLPRGGTLLFPSNAITASLNITVYGDTTFEPDEQFVLSLSNPANATLATNQAIGTIINDDAPPQVTILDGQVFEGSAGTTPVVFLLLLSSASYQTVTVDYATANGAADATDYLPASGTLLFSPGTVTQALTILVNGDLNGEPHENLFVNLFNPTNTSLSRTQAVGVILNDDPPCIYISDVQAIEGNIGSTNAVLTVSLTSTNDMAVTVDYTTADGSALAGVDYVSQSGRLAFPLGTTNLTVTVPVLGDTVIETNEFFRVLLSNPTNGTICRAESRGTIIDDDQPFLSINDVALVEGNSGTPNAVFTITLSASNNVPVTVNYATSNGTASASSDYVSKSGTLTFPPGITLTSITVVVKGDAVYEPDETFFLTLSNPTNAVLGRSVGQGDILNDEPFPQFSISDAVVNEGNAGQSLAFFSVTSSFPSFQTTRVDYTTADLTATAGSDYLAASGTLIFAPMETNKTVLVTVNGDRIYETNELFLVALANPANAALGRNPGLGTILNDDPLPSLYVDDVTLMEGDVGTTNAVFRVGLSGVSSQPVMVQYLTTNGSASAGSDYAATNGLLVFPPGVTNQSINVAVLGDEIDESTETLSLLLTNAVGATNADGLAVGTILNDDGIQISINDVSVPEVNSGTISAQFTVRLSRPASRTVTVYASTADGTAMVGSDYLRVTNAPIIFPAGTTNQTFLVQVVGDLIDEPDETFFVYLSNPSPANASLGDAQGICTIVDNDPPCITISDIAVTDIQSGTTNAVFVLALSSATAQTVTVHFASSNGTAVAGSDYVAASGTVTFSPFTTNATLAIQVNPNTMDETNEFFFVTLSSPVQATMCDSLAVGTILSRTVTNQPPLVTLAQPAEGSCFTLPTNILLHANATDSDGLVVAVEFFANTNKIGEATSSSSGNWFDFVWSNAVPGYLALTAKAHDNVGATTISSGVNIVVNPQPVIFAPDLAVAENITNAIFNVNLSGPVCIAVTVDVSTTNGTALAGQDYSAIPLTRLTFLPGETNKTVAVPIIEDSLNEPGEILFLSLSNPTNAVLGTTKAIATILDNDPLPSITINDVVVSEGDTGTTGAVFVANLSATSGQTITVDYATASSIAVCLSSYSAATGRLAFSPGTTSQTIIVPVIGDIAREANELFFINLSNPTNASVLTAQGVGTILDDDPQPTITISDVAVLEGASGTNAPFTVSLSRPTCFPVSLQYATADGGASAGSDFNGLSPTPLTFAPLETNKTIVVTILGDALDEPDENFFVNLSNPTNATLSRSQGVGTIVDDDLAPSVSINDRAVKEGESGTTNATFTASLSAASGQAVTISYFTADGTATAGSDYAALPMTPLIFAAGQTSKTVAVTVFGDTLVESNETFLVVLTNAANATLAGTVGVGTILDDDQPATNLPPSVTITSPTNGSVFTSPATVLISANGSDSDGVVQRLDFFAGPNWLGSISNAAGVYSWTNNAVGSYVLTATALDDRGATGTSAPVNISIVANGSPTIAIVRNFADPEINKLQDYSHEMGLESQVFDQEGLNIGALSGFQLIIWDDLGVVSQGLSTNEVAIFQALSQTGKSLYFIGERLTTSGNSLPEPYRTQWRNLLHLTSSSAIGGNGVVSILTATNDQVIQSVFGTVTDYPYPTGVELATTTGNHGALLLGRSGSADVLLAYESPTTSARSFSQNTLVYGGVGACAVEERRRLFKNTVFWLTHSDMSFPSYNVHVDLWQAADQLRAGEMQIYTLLVSQTGAIPTTGVVLTDFLPPGMLFVSASASQGTCTNLCGVVTCFLGELYFSQATVTILALPTVGGTFTNIASVSGNEPEPIRLTPDDSARLAMTVTGSALCQLAIERLEVDRIKLSLTGEPGRHFIIQQSTNLTTWQIYADFTNTAGTTSFTNTLPVGSTQKFYRAYAP